MKKRIVGYFLAIALTTVAIVGCGGKSEDVAEATTSTAEDKGQSEESGVLRVGMECAYAPFNWTQETAEVANGATAVPIYDSGYYAYGYDVMVAQKLADEMGLELEIHKVEWDSIGMGLDAGKYDCIIAGMGKTVEREQAYDFTEPYYYRDICVTVKKGSELENITKLSEFAGKGVKITTQLGTAWVDLIEQIPDGEAVANYATTAECFMAVSNGAAGACVIDLPTSQSAAMTNDDLVLLQLDSDDTIEDPTGSTNVCIAVRKGDTELRDKIQGAMDAIKWNDKAEMDKTMEEAIKLQPAAS